MSLSHNKSVLFISKWPLQVPFHELPPLTVKSEECFKEWVKGRAKFPISDNRRIETHQLLITSLDSQ